MGLPKNTLERSRVFLYLSGRFFSRIRSVLKRYSKPIPERPWCDPIFGKPMTLPVTMKQAAIRLDEGAWPKRQDWAGRELPTHWFSGLRTQ